MENHDTFAPSNIIDIENWIIVGMACLKMLSFFWPVLVVAIVLCVLESKKVTK